MVLAVPAVGPGAKIDGEFVVRDTLGKGKGGGAVYRVKRLSRPDSPLVALKYPASDTELKALVGVQESLGVPRLLASGHYRGHRYAVTQLLGQPLSEIFQRIEPMSVEDKWGIVRLFGRVLLRRLEAVHRLGWVHGDVAPDNFLFGRTDSGDVTLFLIDFGCARPFPGGEAVKAFWNTVEFASVRAVDETVREPYDDLESLGYVLCHGIFGELPWFRWTRGRANWEETRGRDCARVQQVKHTLLRGEWCSLGFEWIHLMKMPPDLTKLLARCLYRPLAEDGLPDYRTLAGLLGEGPWGPEVAEAVDVGFLTERCYDLAPPHQPEQPCAAAPPAPAPCGGGAAAVPGVAGPPAPAAPREARRGDAPGPVGPNHTRAALFDFDELEDELPQAGTVPLEGVANEAGAIALADQEAPVVLVEERYTQEAGCAVAAEKPSTPRTGSAWFDFDALCDVEAA